MPRPERAVFACIALLTLALLVSGCSDDSSPAGPEQEAPAFKTLTAPENLIYNLVLSHEQLNITQYARLLLGTADGDYGKEYYWYFQEGDVPVLGEEYLDREADIARTANMFLAAKGTPAKPEHPVIDKLVLEVLDGAWASEDSLWGEPCEDCWSTSRDYRIRITIGEDIIRGIGQVDFYVVPVQVGDATEYRIAQAYDIYSE